MKVFLLPKALILQMHFLLTLVQYGNMQRKRFNPG